MSLQTDDRYYKPDRLDEYGHEVCRTVYRSFDETVETAITLDGRKFSPLLIARLRDPDVVERLRDAFTQGRKDAFRCLYDTQKGDSA